MIDSIEYQKYITFCKINIIKGIEILIDIEILDILHNFKYDIELLKLYFMLIERISIRRYTNKCLILYRNNGFYHHNSDA